MALEIASKRLIIYQEWNDILSHSVLKPSLVKNHEFWVIIFSVYQYIQNQTQHVSWTATMFCLLMSLYLIQEQNIMYKHFEITFYLHCFILLYKSYSAFYEYFQMTNILCISHLFNAFWFKFYMLLLNNIKLGQINRGLHNCIKQIFFNWTNVCKELMLLFMFCIRSYFIYAFI